MRMPNFKRAFSVCGLVAAMSLALAACAPLSSTGTSRTNIGLSAMSAPPTAPVALLTPPPQSDGKPTLVEAPCAHPLPAGLVEGESVSCGRVRVPQDRAWPDDLWLELPYTVIHRANVEAEPTATQRPLLFLTGDALANFSAIYEALRPFRAERDIVLYEPRGMPLAIPNLNCPPAAPVDAATRARIEAQVDKSYQPIPEGLFSLPQCVDALAQKGIDLIHYDTESNADDAAALMQVLGQTMGFDQYDIYAVSQGTRVALELMRAHAGNIHAVVLDSVQPPSVRVYETQPTEARFEVAMGVLDQCEANAACNTSFTRLKARYADLVARLNQTPISLGLDTQPTFSGDDLLQFLLTRLTPDNVSFVPLMIHELDLGETRTLVNLLQAPVASMPNSALATTAPTAASTAVPTFATSPQAMLETSKAASNGQPNIAQMASACRDEWAFTQYQTALAAHKTLNIPDPLVAGDVATLRAWGAACALLPTGKAPLRQAEPVRSAIPTLIYQGLLDSVTPPSWSAAARKTLSHHYHFEFPGQTHDILQQPLTLKTGCATRMAIQFYHLPDEAPGSECIEPNYGFAFFIENRDPSVVAQGPLRARARH